MLRRNLAVQFHPELTSGMLAGWLGNGGASRAAAAGLDPDELLAATRDLGYRPNAAARTPVTGRTNVPGVISIDPALFGPASMLYGIERAAPPAHSVAIARPAEFNRARVAGAGAK